jgi:hypothetical protein
MTQDNIIQQSRAAGRLASHVVEENMSRRKFLALRVHQLEEYKLIVTVVRSGD